MFMTIWRFHQPGRDAKGAALALFTARLHRPDVTTHKAVLQAIIYQLDKAIERYFSGQTICTNTPLFILGTIFLYGSLFFLIDFIFY